MELPYYIFLLLTVLIYQLQFVFSTDEDDDDDDDDNDDNYEFSDKDHRDLMRYAEATWNCMVAMTFPETGLPVDKLKRNKRQAQYTYITNIGAYMWSAIVARDIGLIAPEEAVERVNVTLNTLHKMAKYDGLFSRGYNAKTAAVNGERYVSSVDSGWLAISLILVKNAIPELREQADALVRDMDFGLFYNEYEGLLCRRYETEEESRECITYKWLNGETRIAAYFAIARKQVPPNLYFKLLRTKPPNCRDKGMEMMPEGVYRTYLGEKVFEGHFTYRNMQIVPNNGGSMFEALMVPLFVPEVEWGTKNWAINHPLYSRAHIEHGLEEAEYGIWGFSHCENPSGGYRAYGVDALGNIPNGHFSNNDDTGVDYGYPTCPGSPRKPKPDPPPSEYTNGVVTAHAIFLALPFHPETAMKALRKLENVYDMFGKYGFYDAVNVETYEIAEYHLSLDQGMIMASLGNVLRDNILHKYLAAEPGWKENVRPLLQMEEFTAGLAE